LVDENEEEFAIILVRNSKDTSLGILLNHVHLHVLTLKIVTPYLVLCAEAVSMQLEQLIGSTARSYQLLTVISDNHADDIQMGLDVVSLGKIIKDLVVILKHIDAFNLQELFLHADVQLRFASSLNHLVQIVAVIISAFELVVFEIVIIFASKYLLFRSL
jgi:hypothetical protein